MDINRNNYEAFLLDLLEGKLSPGQERELREFLQRNPDCPAIELDPDEFTLEIEEVRYPSRGGLKRRIPQKPMDIDETDFDLFSVARLEGDLSVEQNARHDEIIREDNEKMKGWDLWKQTRLVARTVRFPGKAGLKRDPGILRRINTMARGRMFRLAAVATAAVIALLFLLFRPDTMDTMTELVTTETPSGTHDEIPYVEPVEEGPSVLSGQSGSQAEKPTPSDPVTGNRERLASTPVTLSIKKKQDPPELIGTGKSGGSFTGGQDTVTATGKQIVRPERLRMAALVSQPAPIPRYEVYDRIKPLALPPSRVNMSGLKLSRLSALDMAEMFEELTVDNQLSFWTIAHSGIEGINRIAGTDMTLLAHRDEEGEVSGIEFKSRIFSFIRPLDREE